MPQESEAELYSDEEDEEQPPPALWMESLKPLPNLRDLSVQKPCLKKPKSLNKALSYTMQFAGNNKRWKLLFEQHSAQQRHSKLPFEY
eukprot:2725145-Amphidinium_carterae.1